MNKAEFSRLYMELLPGLYRLALSILCNEADAEDAVQQSAVNAWQVRSRIRSGSERAYLTRILINVCRDTQRQRMKTFPVRDVPDVVAPDEDSSLRPALDSLPEKLRTPLLLKYMEGWSEREISAALRITLYAVKSRLRRGREALARQLKEEENQ